MNRTQLINDIVLLDSRLHVRRFKLICERQRVESYLRKSNPCWWIAAGTSTGFLAGLLIRTRSLQLLLGLLRRATPLTELHRMVQITEVTSARSDT